MTSTPSSRLAGLPESTPWQPPPLPIADETQHFWLTAGGSLTARLAELGQVTVEVIHEAQGHCLADETICFDEPASAFMWLRHVVLRLDKTPVVAARSVTSLADSLGVWRAIRDLGTQPLADLLYQDAQVERSAMSNARIRSAHALGQQALAASSQSSTTEDAPDFLARRSVFYRMNCPLLVTECMLPALWARLRSAD